MHTQIQLQYVTHQHDINLTVGKYWKISQKGHSEGRHIDNVLQDVIKDLQGFTGKSEIVTITSYLLHNP